MPPKRRNLTPVELLAAAEALQIAILDGIARARRWARSEIAFQGGTSLHLAYGSPRASEDLDFIVASDKGLAAVMENAVSHARAFVRQAVGPQAELEVKARAADTAGQERNPRMFTIAFKAPAFLEAVKIRVEFYVAPPDVAAGYKAEVRQSRLSREAQMRRPIKLAISQAFMPTGDLGEIFADKIYAIAGREYLKQRDIFDLWWLEQEGVVLAGADLLDALRHRHALYPGGPAIDETFAETLRHRARELVTPAGIASLAADLRRWLALTDNPLLSTPEHADTIACTAVARIEAAADTVMASLKPVRRKPRT